MQAVFLKGSMARGTHDEYSDVDFYCLVDASQMDAFLSRRQHILQQYRPIIFRAEANFVGPQAVVIYDNYLHVDLYAVTLDNLPTMTPIKILHDPDNLLADYPAEPLSISSEGAVRHFNYVAFTLYEIYNAVQRDNIIWARYLVGRMTHDLATVYRYLHDPANAQLGIRHIDRLLDAPLQARFLAAAKAPVIQSAILYADILYDVVQAFPPDAPLNLVFFRQMRQQLTDLHDGHHTADHA